MELLLSALLVVFFYLGYVFVFKKRVEARRLKREGQAVQNFGGGTPIDEVPTRHSENEM
jgi:hypothetical protein